MTEQLKTNFLFNLPTSSFYYLLNIGLDLNMLFILERIYNGDTYIQNDPKTKSWLQTLTRKGYLSKNKVTPLGQQLLQTHMGNTPIEDIPVVKVEQQLEDFDSWWKTYPPGDTFSYQGKRFEGSRAFKVKKEECRIKFKKILDEGEYTASDLIAALKEEVRQKKERSLKERANKLSYMQNTLTYLNQRTFEGYIEMKQEEPSTPQHSTGGIVNI